MSLEREGSLTGQLDGGGGGEKDGAVGKRPRSVARAARGAPAPTVEDVATVAVEGKQAGRAMDAGVSGQVGQHLGRDFSDVRVHDDPLARSATAAMGARAFAYGADVFLGPGESDRDLGLMAHELTHVAQQGAAGQRAPQRLVEVGASDSPAEREAEAVASEITSGTGKPAALVVDDGPVQPGQMLKSTFIDQLRQAVSAAAAEEMGPLGSIVGCPYIDQYFGRYANQPAATGEALLKRYAPATRTVTTAEAMIPIVVTRVREGVRHWRDTGKPPADLPASAVPSEVAPPAPETPVDSAMGPGETLDGATAARMSDGLGEDVGAARIHVGPEAAAFAASQRALAVTVGSDIAFASGAYAPGTLEGDALLAHELAHTVQQRGASPAAMAAPAAESAAHEEDADQAAGGVLQRLWGGVASAARRVGPALRAGYSMQRCPEEKKFPKGSDTATGKAKHTTGKQADDYLSKSKAIGSFVAAKFKGGTKADGVVHFYTPDEFREANWVRKKGSTNDATGKDWTKDEAYKHADTLEGFAYDGGIYVNQDKGQEDTVIHEAIHLFQSGTFVSRCGNPAKEGATEHFTHVICAEQKLTATNSYPDEHKSIKKVIAVTSENAMAAAFFEGKVDDLATEVDKAKGKGTFDKWCTHMKAKEFSKADALL